MPDLPSSPRFVVVGAGIHGLSTAYHLAKELRARGAGSGAEVVVLEKSEPGAGASGIACGVVRNNYFQPAMSELMQACVEVWDSDPAAYHYNDVGYIALGPAVALPRRPAAKRPGPRGPRADAGTDPCRRGIPPESARTPPALDRVGGRRPGPGRLAVS